MRLSLKRLLIFAYLTICAFLSFINYRHTIADYDQSDQPSKIDSDHSRSATSASIDHHADHPINRSGLIDQKLNLWQRLKNDFMQELAAVIPQRILFPFARDPIEKTLISDQDKSIIDKALWPEESTMSDRIVAQIEYTLDSPQISAPDHDDQKKSILIFLPHGLRSWNVEAGDKEFKRQQCRISNCRLTDYRSEADKADAVVFRNHFSGGFERHSENQIWIFYTLESPENTPSLILFKDTINWTATYRFDSDLVTPYEKFRTYPDQEVMIRKQSILINYAQNKTKQVAWFVSNCLTSNRRQEYAQRLMQHIQVDIYGTCGPLKCSRYDPKCGQLLDNEYRFYLAFENSNCRDYITEKFFVQGLQ